MDKKTICLSCDGSGYINKSISNVTQKQMKLFKSFKKFYNDNGYAPSVRTLAAIEMEAPTSIYNKMIALVEKGILGRESNGKLKAWNNWYIKKDIERR